MHTPCVIVLNGPAASGKLTIARELALLTGFALFHNHLTVDLLLTLFPFGSPQFVAHRERIWLDLMSDAVAAGRSLIFTFNPERSVRPDFPEVLRARINEAGGSLLFAEVRCDEVEIERRIESESRAGFHKLNSLEHYRKLKEEGAFDYPPIASECCIDSASTTPQESAASIAAALGLAGDASPSV